jgi:hypothetical protein
METKVISYGTLDQGPKQRLGIIAWFLAEMAGQGKTVQLVHPLVDTARALEAQLDVPVLNVYDFNWAHVSADCICIVDGDVIDHRAIERLKYFGKPVYILAPAGALPDVGPGNVLEDLLEKANLVPALTDDEDQPRTFACHHNAPTCGNCDSLVSNWKITRRERVLTPKA